MKEITALEYFQEKARMTKPGYLGICQIDCDDCPLNRDNNEMRVGCRELEYFYTKEAVSIVQKWSEAHPRKTILQDFLEMHPNALLMGEGFPAICSHHLGYEEETCVQAFDGKCKACWNRPLEEAGKCLK